MATATSDDHRPPRAGQPLCVPNSHQVSHSQACPLARAPASSRLRLRFLSEPYNIYFNANASALFSPCLTRDELVSMGGR